MAGSSAGGVVLVRCDVGALGGMRDAHESRVEGCIAQRQRSGATPAPSTGMYVLSQLGSPNNTPLLLTLQGRDHPKLHKQLDYLGKLVAATVHAMGSAAPGGQ